jgi:N-acetylglucosamine-6-phosphate deacetylase
MTSQSTAYLGATIFDGATMLEDCALVVRGGKVEGVCATFETPADANRVTLDGGILAPGFVDLQVNGGGGVMFNSAPTVETLRVMAKAHAGLGATSILPTLITDTPDQVRAAVAAVETAILEKISGIAGLHLEGPHLSLARKGAHDPSLIRRMEPSDEAFLLEAAGRLPLLKVTIAPENVSPEQMKRLSDAGILLSLGHSDASYDDCMRAAQNGVRCVTHLFNAMSQLGNREPGLVGATLSCGDLSAGLIADMVHVHPSTIAAALRAKTGPGCIFLVSDAMATAGSQLDHFFLNGRRITRSKNRLTLPDGTLAGADLDLASAVRNLVERSSVDLAQALAMATSIPATLIGRQGDLGHLAPGMRADFVHLLGGTLSAIWQAGVSINRPRDGRSTSH